MKQKKVYLEAIRILSLFFVLYTHTGNYGMHHYLETSNPINYWFSQCMVLLSQTCVPLFFMISGAVLLQKESTFREVWTKRIPRMLIVILLAGLFQYYYNYRLNPDIGFSLKVWLQLTYGGKICTQHWFLYSYLAFLMILPFLQKLVKSLPNRWFLILLGMQVCITGILPIFEYYAEYPGINLEIPLFTNCIFYTMLGYYIEHRSKEEFTGIKPLLFWSGGALGAFILNLHMQNISMKEHGSLIYNNLFTGLFTFVIFIIIRYIFTKLKLPKWIEKFLCFCGAGVFGTYLLDIPLRNFFEPVYLFLNTRIFSYPALFAWLFVCMATGIVFINILKLIPGIKKLL